MDTESTELNMAEEAAMAEIAQKFVQRLRLGNWGRRKRVFVKGIGQSWRLYEGIRRFCGKLGMAQMGSLVRGGLRGRRSNGTNRVIFIDDDMKAGTIIVTVIFVRDRGGGG